MTEADEYKDFTGKKAETYFLLKNYVETGNTARNLVISQLIQALRIINQRRQLEQNGQIIDLDEGTLQLIRSILQLDIISKMMMYTEDLFVILDSMLSAEGNYCDVLARENDLGDFLKRFTSNLESLPKDKYRKILSYVDPAQIPDTAKGKVVEKLIDQNIEVFKSFLILVRDFSRPHSKAHKKYKHGGIPIRQPYAIVSKSIDLTGFDAYSIIMTENTISKPVTLLPSSPKGTEAYDLLSSKIEKYLIDVVENRIRIIERKIEGLIPLENYNPATFTKEELDLLEEAKKEFDAKRLPKIKEGVFDLSGIVTDTELLRWYQGIDDFMNRMNSL